MKNRTIFVLVLFIMFLAGILRFWHLSTVPPSLYWDEVSQAYNAYSILKTGKDEHGEFLPIARFKAFGDYKAPVYIYSLVPSIALFGKTEFAVRFPSALYGTLTVLLTYFLVLEIFRKKDNGNVQVGNWEITKLGNWKLTEIIALISAGLLAISPWHIQLSRAAFEGNAAVFYSLLGIWLFFASIRKRNWLLVMSCVSLVIAFYAFNGFRLFIPMITLILGILYYKDLRQMKKQVITSVVIGLLLIIPFIQFLQTPESKLRFKEVNIFSDLSIIEKSNNWQTLDNNSPLSRILHNRRVLYSLSYIKHYFDFFNPTYLFISGDENPRFSSQDVGQLYLWMLPLLLIGFYQMLTKPSKERLFILLWFLIAPLAAATARETPHALRSATYIPTYEIIASVGAVTVFVWLRNQKKAVYWIGVGGSVAIIGISMTLFLHNYFVHYPKDFAGTWQYGYKQALEYVKNNKDKYDFVYISDAYGRPYIYTAWYGNIDPEEFHKTAVIHGDADGFYSVERIGKYNFGDISSAKTLRGSTLYITSPTEVPEGSIKKAEINFPNGNPAFIVSVKP